MRKPDARIMVNMARLQRRIAVCLKEGETLSSPKVVALSRRLDQLVLACYQGH
jgi:hypothetical protein